MYRDGIPGIPAREIPGKSRIFSSRFPGNIFLNFPGNSGNFEPLFLRIMGNFPVFLANLIKINTYLFWHKLQKYSILGQFFKQIMKIDFLPEFGRFLGSKLFSHKKWKIVLQNQTEWLKTSIVQQINSF